MKHTLNTSLILLSLASIDVHAQTAQQYLEKQKPGLYGAITVNEKIIFFELYHKRAPLTVTNFVGLATGKFDGHVTKEKNYFDGIVFHRVVDNFVIQGGDPTGTGTGGPGYNFPDEFNSSLTHSSEGILSMANAGPNTNGSQFFITLAPTPHLNNVHSVFGKVIEGMDVVKAVKEGAVITSVEIFAKGTDAQAFLENVSWEKFQAELDSHEERKTQERVKKIQNVIAALNRDKSFTETPEGIFYKLEKKGTGKQVLLGDSVEVHYELTLYQSKKIIDSSYSRNETFTLTVGARQVIPGWEIILQKLVVGDKAIVVIPPNLAYGENGVGPIPPNSFLQFTMEVIRVQ